MVGAVASGQRADRLPVRGPACLVRPLQPPAFLRAAASSQSWRAASTWYSFQRPSCVATWLPIEIKPASADLSGTGSWSGNLVATTLQGGSFGLDWQSGRQPPPGFMLRPSALAMLRRQTLRQGRRIGRRCRWHACRSWPIRRTSGRRTPSRIQPTCCS